MTRVQKSILIASAALGMLIGAATAHDEGLGLVILMAIVGIGFALPLGAGIASVLGKRTEGRDAQEICADEYAAHTMKNERDAPLAEQRVPQHDYYAGNPDPVAKVMSGWIDPNDRSTLRRD